MLFPIFSLRSEFLFWVKTIHAKMLPCCHNFPPLELLLPRSYTHTNNMRELQMKAIGQCFHVQVISHIPPNLLPCCSMGMHFSQNLQSLDGKFYSYGLQCLVPDVHLLYDQTLYSWHDLLYDLHGKDFRSVLSRLDFDANTAVTNFKVAAAVNSMSLSTAPIKIAAPDVVKVKCRNIYFLLIALGFTDFALQFITGDRVNKLEKVQKDISRFGNLLKPQLLSISQTILEDSKIATIGYVDMLPGVNAGVPYQPDATPGVIPFNTSSLQYSF